MKIYQQSILKNPIHPVMKFNIELFEKAPIIGILRNINEETVKNILPFILKWIQFSRNYNEFNKSS